MSAQFKPFRLINSQELQAILQTFANQLRAWNQQYALFSLSASVNAHPKAPNAQEGTLFYTKEKKPLAFIAENNLSLVKEAVFGDLSDSFNPISKKFLIELIKSLLQSQNLEQCTLAADESIHKDWFYTGAPSLALNLSTVNHSLTVYLHPQWVLEQLPIHERIHKPKALVQEALASQALNCEVQMKPLQLPLEDIIRLKIGDVIKTDHLLSEPLRLVHKQQTICQAEAGSTNLYKSIQIKSVL